MAGDRSQARRRWLWKQRKRKCAYCGVRLYRNKGPYRLTCDHIVPLSRGGTHERKNLAAACGPCNQAKGNLTAEEFTQEVDLAA